MWKSALGSIAATSAFVLSMTLSVAAETSIARSPEAKAVVSLEGAAYHFSGNCLLMSRGKATQLRMTIPGSGPDDEHVFLAIYATTFAPTQFTIYTGPTADAARDASLTDDQSAWRVRGGAPKENIDFSEASLSAEMTAAVYSNGEKVGDETVARLEITGC